MPLARHTQYAPLGSRNFSGVYERECVCGGGKKRENSYRMQETLNPSLAQFQFGQFRRKNRSKSES